MTEQYVLFFRGGEYGLVRVENFMKCSIMWESTDIIRYSKASLLQIDSTVGILGLSLVRSKTPRLLHSRPAFFNLAEPHPRHVIPTTTQFEPYFRLAASIIVKHLGVCAKKHRRNHSGSGVIDLRN